MLCGNSSRFSHRSTMSMKFQMMHLDIIECMQCEIIAEWNGTVIKRVYRMWFPLLLFSGHIYLHIFGVFKYKRICWLNK